MDIIALSLITALAIVIIMLILGAYKKASSVLNVEEIKNAIKGVTLTFILFAVVAQKMRPMSILWAYYV